jgi:hypothetical protein
MDQEFFKRTRKVMSAARDAMESVLRADDDVVLESEFVYDYDVGGETMEPTMLEMARAKVERLLAEAQSAQREKEKLEKLVRDQKKQEPAGKFFSGRLNRSGRFEYESFSSPMPPKIETVPLFKITDDVLGYLRSHGLPLPGKTTALPELTIEQQARVAHNDCYEALTRLSEARHELNALEKKVNDLRDLLRCV